MDPGPLVSEEIKSGEEIARGFARKYPVAAAFWLKDSDEMEWFLYIASEMVGDGSGKTDGYAEISRLGRENPNPFFDPMRVKLIDSKHKLAKAVIDMYNRYPSNYPKRYRGPIIGGMGVNDGYIYAPIPTPPAVD